MTFLRNLWKIYRQIKNKSGIAASERSGGSVLKDSYTKENSVRVNGQRGLDLLQRGLFVDKKQKRFFFTEGKKNVDLSSTRKASFTYINLLPQIPLLIWSGTIIWGLTSFFSIPDKIFNFLNVMANKASHWVETYKILNKLNQIFEKLLNMDTEIYNNLEKINTNILINSQRMDHLARNPYSGGFMNSVESGLTVNSLYNGILIFGTLLLFGFGIKWLTSDTDSFIEENTKNLREHQEAIRNELKENIAVVNNNIKEASDRVKENGTMIFKLRGEELVNLKSDHEGLQGQIKTGFESLVENIAFIRNVSMETLIDLQKVRKQLTFLENHVVHGNHLLCEFRNLNALYLQNTNLDLFNKISAENNETISSSQAGYIHYLHIKDPHLARHSFDVLTRQTPDPAIDILDLKQMKFEPLFFTWFPSLGEIFYFFLPYHILAVFIYAFVFYGKLSYSFLCLPWKTKLFEIFTILKDKLKYFISFFFILLPHGQSSLVYAMDEEKKEQKVKSLIYEDIAPKFYPFDSEKEQGFQPQPDLNRRPALKPKLDLEIPKRENLGQDLVNKVQSPDKLQPFTPFMPGEELTKEKLWERMIKHAKVPEKLNQEEKAIWLENRGKYFQEGQELLNAIKIRADSPIKKSKDDLDIGSVKKRILNQEQEMKQPPFEEKQGEGVYAKGEGMLRNQKMDPQPRLSLRERIRAAQEQALDTLEGFSNRFNLFDISHTEDHSGSLNNKKTGESGANPLMLQYRQDNRVQRQEQLREERRVNVEMEELPERRNLPVYDVQRPDRSFSNFFNNFGHWLSEHFLYPTLTVAGVTALGYGIYTVFRTRPNPLGTSLTGESNGNINSQRQFLNRPQVQRDGGILRSVYRMVLHGVLLFENWITGPNSGNFSGASNNKK